ncbi:MAG: TonB-dependent receptor [Cyclobacteriaceae bacterium]
MLKTALVTFLLAIVQTAWTQTVITITDSSNGSPLSGASIQFENGEVKISGNKGQVEIDQASNVTISHVGYQSKRVEIGDEAMTISLEAGNFNLQEVTITAYHANRKLLDTPGPTAVISKKDLNRSQDLIFTDAVNRIPGVYMHSGALNTNRITIRGIGSRSRFSTNRVKGYINEIPLTTGDGETSLEDIDMSLIDRVEIVKGPSSSEYGAALGGTIHLKTARPEFGISRITTDTQIGSFGLFRNNSAFDLGLENGVLKFWASKTENDGFRQNNEYDRESGAIIGQFDLTEKTSLSFLFNFIDLKAFIPSSIDSSTFAENRRAAATNWLNAQGHEDYEKGNIGFAFNHRISERFNVAYSVFTSFRNANEVRPFDILKENSNAYGVRFKYQYNLGESKALPIVTFGTEMFSDKLIASTHNNDSIPDLPVFIESHDDIKRQYQNYFLQGDWQFNDRLAVVAGANLNKTEYSFEDLFRQDGDQSGEVKYDWIASPRLGVNYKLNQNAALHFSISHGFGTPTFEETRDSRGFINPDIQPEAGYNYEIGSRGSLLNSRLSYDVSIYTMRIRNLLVSRRIAEDQLLGVNAGKTTQNGLELAFGYKLIERAKGFIRNLNAHVNYSLADYEFNSFIDEGNDFSGNQLTGTPKNTFNGILDLTTSAGLYGNLNYRFVDEIPILDDNSVFSEAFQVVNLKLGYQKSIGRFGFDFYGGINNLFDEAYASQVLINPNFGRRYFYPGQDRNWYWGLRFDYYLK